MRKLDAAFTPRTPSSSSSCRYRLPLTLLVVSWPLHALDALVYWQADLAHRADHQSAGLRRQRGRGPKEVWCRSTAKKSFLHHPSRSPPQALLPAAVREAAVGMYMTQRPHLGDPFDPNLSPSSTSRPLARISRVFGHKGEWFHT